MIDYIAKYRDDIFHFIFMTGMPNRRKIVPTGKGIIDWKKLLETAKKSGIADYGMIVEMETRAPEILYRILLNAINTCRI